MKRQSRARYEGNSVGLGEFTTDMPQRPYEKECERKHRWTESRYNRKCSRCGKEEEKL